MYQYVLVFIFPFLSACLPGTRDELCYQDDIDIDTDIGIELRSTRNEGDPRISNLISVPRFL